MATEARAKRAVRSILHIDMNAFYCACHAADEPDLYLGRPTAVAGSPETRHGVVVTASYEARRRGVRATMTVAQALRVCPELILIHPNFDLYRAFSRRVFDVVRNYTPQVEVFSIDECWADVSGSSQFGSAVEIAQVIQNRVHDELGLPCSIGVAPNKFLAKMASDLEKPMGLTELCLSRLPILLWPLAVEDMFGVGEKTGERLRRMGMATIGDLAAARSDLLARHLGKRGIELQQHANGHDDDPVQAIPEAVKSVGHSITLADDTDSLEALYTVLLNLSDQVGRRVRRHTMVGRTVQLTLRYANRETVTRSHTLAQVTNLTEDIYSAARQLLSDKRRPGAKIRLIGVTLQNLSPQRSQLDSNGARSAATVDTELDAGGEQLELPLFSLGDNELGTPEAVRHKTTTGSVADTPADQAARRERLQRLTEVSDKLRDRYGEDVLVRGRMLQPHESSQIRDRKLRGTSLQKDTLGERFNPQ